jgi:hypothetical protein
MHTTTSYSSFEIVYGFNPFTPLDLMPLPIDEMSSLDGHRKAKLVKSIHEKVLIQIAQKNEKFASQANKGWRRVIFEPGDWVWVHMRKERFPAHRRTKLHPWGDGHFQILDKINDFPDEYKVDLPGEYNVSATFNVSDLSPYDAGDDSRSNPFEMMGPMVDRILKIPYKFQMGQSQGQERRRSRKQCKDWCNPLGPSLQIYRARLNMGLKKEPALIHVIQSIDGGGIA